MPIYTARNSKIGSGSIGQLLNLRPTCITQPFRLSCFGAGFAWLKLKASPCHLPILQSLSVYIPDENGEISELAQASVQFSEMAAEMPTADIGAAFSKMLLALAVIIAMLFISYWFLRRLIQNRVEKRDEHSSIQILEKRALSPKTMLYLVEIDQKKVLLAESHLEIKRLESYPIESVSE